MILVEGLGIETLLICLTNDSSRLIFFVNLIELLDISIWMQASSTVIPRKKPVRCFSSPFIWILESSCNRLPRDVCLIAIRETLLWKFVSPQQDSLFSCAFRTHTGNEWASERASERLMIYYIVQIFCHKSSDFLRSNMQLARDRDT